MRRFGTGAAAVLILLAGACQSQDAPPTKSDQVDWQVVADNLERDVQTARRTHPAAATAVRDSNLPLAALEIEKIRQRNAARYRDATWSAEQAASQTVVQDCLDRLAKGRVAHAGVTGNEPDGPGYLARAYLCRTDGSPQPYYVRLPANYSPRRRWPVVVFLHGYVPDTSKINPWVLPAPHWKLATDRGFILVLPHGRRNTDFLGIGEVDVLRVVEEVQRWYNVDPNRIFMTGCSMGGYGGWALGLRHPDQWAALGVMAGQTDFFTWEKRPRDEVDYKSWCILQNNPLDLAVNALHLPMLVQHGAEDPLVPVVHSQLIAPVMKELGYQFEYDEYAGKGHYIYFDDGPFIKLFDFCARHVRPTAPARVRFKTFTPRQGRAWWVDVRRLAQWGPAAEVDAQVKAGRLTVATKNVAELWLDLPKALAAKPVALTIDGQAAGTVVAGPHQVLLRAGAPPAVKPATPPPGRPRVGPAREVFNDAFLLVYATGGGAERAAYNQQQAARFQQVWFAFAEGIAPLVADRDLTAEQVRRHNLVIFGEPDAVTLPGVDEPAAMLPAGVKLGWHDYLVGRRHFRGENLGMVLLTAHPLDAQRLVLWWSGQSYGQALPLNHQLDLLPDLLVYNDRTTWDGANQYLLGGFLSPDWQLDESRLDVGPKTAP